MPKVFQESIQITANFWTDEEAVAYKMKAIHPKLFGLFCPIRYVLSEKRKVYVPYEFFVFSYELRRGRNRDENDALRGFDKSGEIAVVFDMNEVHPFHFDLYESLDLHSTPLSSVDGKLMEPNCTYAESEKRTYETIRWNMLRRIFNGLPKLTLVRRVHFYRPAWRLSLHAGSKSFVKFAYLDKHMAENEHISGLRVRLAT